MRTILFRGKSKVNINYLGEDEPLVKIGEWVYGSLILDNVDNHHIHTLTRRGWEFVKVEIESIGQFIGVLDADGKEIYEGDIIQGNNQWIRHKIEYNEEEASFCAKKSDDHCPIYKWWIDEYEKKVIGNIHDNPEIII